jgi:hypothetical protein
VIRNHETLQAVVQVRDTLLCRFTATALLC